MYIITNGKNYLRQNVKGKYETVSSLSLADTCKTFDAAMNLLTTRASKKTFKDFGVCLYENGNLSEIIYPKSKKGKKKKASKKKANLLELQKVKLDSVSNTKNPNSYIYESDNSHIQKWIDRISAVKNIRNDAEARYKLLNETYDTIMDYECDIMHYIEFNKQNAAARCKINIMQQQLLQLRRKIKDEINILEKILKSYTSDTEDMFNKLYIKLENEKNHKYVPRVFQSLFEYDLNDETKEQFDNLIKSCNNINIYI